MFNTPTYHNLVQLNRNYYTRLCINCVDHFEERCITTSLLLCQAPPPSLVRAAGGEAAGGEYTHYNTSTIKGG